MIKLGDIVVNRNNGLIGQAIKSYKPTGAEDQIMVETFDGRQYHAPAAEWMEVYISLCPDEKFGIQDASRFLSAVQNTSGALPIMSATDNCVMLNPYGEYVLRFAKNHGMTIKPIERSDTID